MTEHLPRAVVSALAALALLTACGGDEAEPSAGAGTGGPAS
ncbi:hypothetical protein [Cellulomonas sp. ATA003]|nr:hypothetical protein [Cellulomonas sp. ATA003]WNB86926.1 hypothetical protein REH70_07150 [Cellulomonas sp. ATA003]